MFCLNLQASVALSSTVKLYILLTGNVLFCFKVLHTLTGKVHLDFIIFYPLFYTCDFMEIYHAYVPWAHLFWKTGVQSHEYSLNSSRSYSVFGFNSISFSFSWRYKETWSICNVCLTKETSKRYAIREFSVCCTDIL